MFWSPTPRVSAFFAFRHVLLLGACSVIDCPAGHVGHPDDFLVVAYLKLHYRYRRVSSKTHSLSVFCLAYLLVFEWVGDASC